MHFCKSTVAVPPPTITFGPHPLQVVNSTKLLGVTVDCKLDWKLHTSTTFRAATYRLYMLRRMRSLGAPQQQLRDIYSTFILPKLTYASPAWSSSLNITQSVRLERVQKRACRIILGSVYTSYDEALITLDLTSLSERFHRDLTQFGLKLMTNGRHKNMLPAILQLPERSHRRTNLIQPIRAVTERYKNSAIPSIVKIVNNKQ